jgi:hypothetical protein
LIVFYNLFVSSGFKEMLLGFGGQDAFQKVAGSAMHSAPLSILIDTGLFAALAVLTFFVQSIKQSLIRAPDVFQIVSIATCFVLPFIPELFFLLCIYLVSQNHLNDKVV